MLKMSVNDPEAVSAFSVYMKKKSKSAKNQVSVSNKKHKNQNLNVGSPNLKPSNGTQSLLKKQKNVTNIDNIKQDHKATNGTSRKRKVEADIKQKLKKKKISDSIGVPKKKKNKLVTDMNSEKNLLKKKKKKSVTNTDSDEEPPLLVPITRHSISRQIPKTNEVEDMKKLISEINKTDPSPEGYKVFKWLIEPMKPKEFLERYWESQVLHIQRHNGNYYRDVLTTERLDDIFREFPLQYTKNVDVVTFENGVKEVHNEEGRVVPAALYDYYLNGCSIRVLNPHTYDQRVYAVLAALQEYFGCMAGANVYLTPPGSQGFAPHYDDIEAFVIQLEGRKHWKLYKPKGSGVLARYSSPNLKYEELGKPFMEVTLNAGDMLYFPRGTIHEGRTDEDSHSFHITISVYQHNSYADLLENVLPDALKKAAQENIEFRQGLPLNFLKHLGYVNKEKSSEVRQTVVNHVKSLMKILAKYVDVDEGADKLGRKFMYDSLPPVLSKPEARYTSKYDGDFMRDGKILNRVEIGMDTEVRLVRYHSIRVVIEDCPKIYYNLDNARVYHGEEEQSLMIDEELLPCVTALQNHYPKFLKVDDLPGEDHLAKARLVSDFWEKGLLVTNGPLEPVGDDGGSTTEDEGSDEECDTISL
ncbi:unnamed protein product [Acanthoscelides obtectus]|uniref:Bifunctional lysine-specific demethylase and histidyl-hydroxylase n=1 Tax=Acanthoscelides obtectus TaxID=200917 RepID=A0A9P0Q4T2_ACAOB|nr:unnamed protein product [Acanthoscelides obtectus]CAK1645886.1 Ribosomal oxygenase 1 [Acanthoscelides obtectus]